MKYYYYALFTALMCLLIPLNTNGQNNFTHQKDSLKQVLTTQDGIEMLTTYGRLIRICFETNNTDQALDTLLIYYDAYDKEARKQDQLKVQGYIRSSRLNALINRNKYEDVIKRAYSDLDFLYQNKLWEHYFEVYQSLIECYVKEQRYGKALSEAKTCYEISQTIKNTEEDLSSAIYPIAFLSKTLNRHSDAEVYFKEIIDNQREKEVSNIVLYSFLDLGHVLIEQKKYDETIEMSKSWAKALEKYRPGQANTGAKYMYYSFLAYLYVRMEQFDKVEYYCNVSEEYMPGDRYLGDMLFYRSLVFESKKNYDKAIELCDQAYKLTAQSNPPFASDMLNAKARMLDKAGRCSEIYPLFDRIEAVRDSLKLITINAQLDELRTVYEVDKHIAEKEEVRSFMYFAIVGCILLLIILGIWVYYNHQIAKKNKALAKQIKELKTQQEKEETELLNRTIFEREDIVDDLCPERRKDQLCIAIRDILLREKRYRDPSITRNHLIEDLGTNKELFVDAFQYCFGMSFPEYLNVLRLKDAIALLDESDLTIQEIAEKVGFGTVRTFQRQFQSKYNMSPKDYRKAASK